MRARTRIPIGGRALTILLAAAALLVAGTTPAGAAFQDSSGNPLTVLEAVVLGLVEGLTEYLPVSSTGHLLVSNELLGLDEPQATKDAIETYAICIQLGAIVAVLFLYWGRIRQMLDGLMGRDADGRNLLNAVLVSFAITSAIALTIGEWVKDQLFGVATIAAAWIVGGVVILALSRRGWFDRAGNGIASLTVRQSVVIGAMQAIAMWPGVSRSMITIIAAVLVGLSLGAAVEFSFLLGLITLTAATGYEALGGGAEIIDTFGIVTPLLGLVVAFVSAMAAVKWMVAWLNEKGFEVFGWYRIGVGVLAFVLLAAGAID